MLVVLPMRFTIKEKMVFGIAQIVALVIIEVESKKDFLKSLKWLKKIANI